MGWIYLSGFQGISTRHGWLWPAASAASPGPGDPLCAVGALIRLGGLGLNKDGLGCSPLALPHASNTIVILGGF